MNQKNSVEKYEHWIPFFLFFLFLAITLPGISWGAPDVWHPDEIVVRALQALEGDTKFEANFDYPNLPQNTMYYLGKILLAFGSQDVLVAARVLSAVMAGFVIILVYFIARRMGANVYIASLSGLLLICASEMSHNGRFAHNDTFITFFATLAVFSLIHFKTTDRKVWLYASFLSVGLAASSKYNGIALILAPVLTYIVSRRRALFMLETLETLTIGGGLTYIGFAIGTPKALTWMALYFKRMIPALLHTGAYGRQPDSVRGYIGQYENFLASTGLPLFILFTAALIWACYKVIRVYAQKQDTPNSQTDGLAILLLSIFALDLPIMISYNYPTRFFLSLTPWFAILGALFVAELYRFAQYRKIFIAALACIILYSMARNISVALLFFNDPRISASEFLKTLPEGTSLEHTYYPPTIPLDRFEREHNYPIHFVKVPGDPLPTSKEYKFNAGEIGLNERQTDYLITDSFTYKRFADPYICAAVQTECDFFKQLDTSRSNHYQLIAEFSYSLPPYLPQITISFVNPVIRIYERIP